MKVSVVMPNYNSEKYLENTINSILKQTLTDFELIIVDDGSTDKSIEIIEEFIKKDNRITLVKQENDKAPGKARNVGYKLTKGEAIIFFDSDDLMNETMLESMYNEIHNNNFDLVICNPLFYDEEKGKYIETKMEKFFSQYTYELKDLFMISPFPVNKMYKKAFLEKTKVTFVEKVFNQDMGYFISNLFHFPKFQIIKDTQMTYLVRANSITTNKKTSKRHIENLTVFNQIYDEYEKTGSNEYFDYCLHQRLLKAMFFKTSFFNPLIDKEYLNMISDYLNSHYPKWHKSIEFKNDYSLLKRIYYIALLKYRLYFILGAYKKLKDLKNK